MIGGAETWGALVAVFAGLFHQPTGIIFTRIVSGWVLCPGRHTIARMYPLVEPDRHKAHNAYPRFFRAGVWCRRMGTETVAALFEIVPEVLAAVCVRHVTATRMDWGWRP